MWSYNPRVPQVNFLQVLASNATNNTNTHHGNQSGKRRGYNFQFPTAEEAKYPFILCQRVAFILKQEAVARGSQFATRLAATGTSGRQRESDNFLHLNHALVSSNHWYLNSSTGLQRVRRYRIANFFGQRCLWLGPYLRAVSSIPDFGRQSPCQEPLL